MVASIISSVGLVRYNFHFNFNLQIAFDTATVVHTKYDDNCRILPPNSLMHFYECGRSSLLVSGSLEFCLIFETGATHSHVNIDNKECV